MCKYCTSQQLTYRKRICTSKKNEQIAIQNWSSIVVFKMQLYSLHNSNISQKKVSEWKSSERVFILKYNIH